MNRLQIEEETGEQRMARFLRFLVLVTKNLLDLSTRSNEVQLTDRISASTAGDRMKSTEGGGEEEQATRHR